MYFPLIVLLAVVSQYSVIADEKVNVSVYYETHCPDSKAFLLNQLIPLSRSAPELINIELYPYGKASHEGSGKDLKFYCQHGPRECKGNTIQACALNQYPLDKVLPFIECMEKAGLPDIASSSCATSNGLDNANITTCADNTEGKELLLKMAQATESLNPRAHFVPWININGVHTDANQNEALVDLLKVVCRNSKGSSDKCK